MRAVPLLLESTHETACLLRARAQPVHLPADVLEQDISVARRTESGAEPSELAPQRVPPDRVNEDVRGTQESSRSPGGDAHLMEILGVQAQARAGVVVDQASLLLEEGMSERHAGWRI